MKLLGIVTIYHPDAGLLRESVLRYAPSLDRLIFWVNSPEDMDVMERLDLPEEIRDKVEVMSTGRNEFISYPLNRAVEYGLEHGYTHLLTMDQDSLFEEDAFERYVGLIEGHKGDCVFCPRIQTEAFVDEVEHRRSLEDLKGLPEPEKIKYSITSGLVCPLRMFRTTGGFREDYQIYMVDVEFGCRAGLCSYPTMKCNSVALHQRYGETRVVRGRVVFNYSPMSRYYRARNRVLFKREYPLSYKWSTLISLLCRETGKIVLYESGKCRKLRAIARGAAEGLFRRTTRMDRAIADGTVAQRVAQQNERTR